MRAPWFWRCLLAAGLAWVGPAWAQPAPMPEGAASATAKPRPRVGLVLSGGGARGFAHIGVLRALQQMRVPVDVVVGASMGAVVGGAYAAGRSVDELEGLALRTDWTGILADRPQRAALSYRRREDDLLLPSRIEFGLTAQGVQLPASAAGNQALESLLRHMVPALSAETPAARLALPYRAVATDLRTGELGELGAEPRLVSLRASLAVPGLFAPLPVNGRL
ncbi:MAG: patatin domain-containing protein, partial [Burkholderiales bacterium PBB5]